MIVAYSNEYCLPIIRDIESQKENLLRGTPENIFDVIDEEYVEEMTKNK